MQNSLKDLDLSKLNPEEAKAKLENVITDAAGDNESIKNIALGRLSKVEGDVNKVDIRDI